MRTTIKCHQNDIEVDENDRVIDNRKCYILITRTIITDWASYHPTIDSETFTSLLGNGQVEKIEGCKYREWGAEYDIYRFTGVEQ